MRAVKHILFIFLLCAGGQAFAQFSKLEKALELYRDKKLDSARICIDAAVVDPQTKLDYNTWMVRGFIYKDLYKQKDAEKASSELRDGAVESFQISLKLDSGNKNPQREGVLKSLKYTATTYHNDINKTLDTFRYEISLANAAKYVAISKFLDPAFDERRYNYDVYITVGSMFEKEFEAKASKGNLDLAKAYLYKAYEIDSSSFLINKNLGLLYYNQAVEIIMRMDYEIPIDQLPLWQDKAVKLGKQSESFLLKAFRINPNDKVLVEALAGMYYLLNDNEKHNEYKAKLEKLRQQ